LKLTYGLIITRDWKIWQYALSAIIDSKLIVETLFFDIAYLFGGTDTMAIKEVKTQERNNNIDRFMAMCREQLHRMGLDGLFSLEYLRYWMAINGAMTQLNANKISELLDNSDAFMDWWEDLEP
jgi:hypothetical protein